jgi:predicted O-methyltransferase YrrM
MRSELPALSAGGGFARFLRALRPRRAHLFNFFERLGFHVTPVHFYQPIPDTRTLGAGPWLHRSELPGIDLRVGAQLELAEEFLSRYAQDYGRLATARDGAAGGYFLDNNYFGRVDAEVLYSMVRRFRPRRVIEIGSGFSSLVTVRALADAAADGAPPAEFLTIDPERNQAFRDQGELQAAAGGAVRCTVILGQIQELPISEFLGLGADDILFIDSSHVLAIGSDVQYLFLEVLPRLRKGVVVHVHDVFFPCEYPKRWVLGFHLFWTEQYLLQSFLSFNRAFEVLWAGHYLHTYHPDALRRAFASYDPATVEPGSFWMRRIE